jgi:hypothetical protein
MRLLVLSYFIALSLGWIGGTPMLEFMFPVLPDVVAAYLMQGIILFLSFLIFIGIGRRPAALIMSLIVFFSSYTALYTGGDISPFWRDLALIGALLMTADFKRPEAMPSEWEESNVHEVEMQTVSNPEPAKAEPMDDQPFRDDFDMARVMARTN